MTALRPGNDGGFTHTYRVKIAQYEVMLGLWNVDELGKINEWVTDDRLNLEAAENDPKLLQLRVLIDKQNGVNIHMYGITTTEWRKFLEDCLEITPATALPSRLTQMYMYAACY